MAHGAGGESMKVVYCVRVAAYIVAALCSASLEAQTIQPWLDKNRSADERARLAVAAMTLEEKISLLHGPMAIPFVKPESPLPSEAILSAGYIPGIPRLGIPALKETDASLGVVDLGGLRPGAKATALPSSLALAASFNPDLAYQVGLLLGSEAHTEGFNVLLGGGANLARDPRNGRNFEYLGEDPLLTGMLAGEAVRGTQHEHVISTVKHFALNANETNRTTLNARIDRNALRESDLLAFQLAIERGQPGSIMCSYNLVNGAYACGNDWLLNEVLKREWHFPGWVMSDWGAVHAADYALHGLDQESGEQLDLQVYFAAPLRAAVDAKTIPVARIDDMVRRILRSMFSVGVIDNPPQAAAIDYPKHSELALEEERQGIVLLKNAAQLLPLAEGIKRIAVIGGQAQAGVLSGGGSSQTSPSNGVAIKIPIGGRGIMGTLRNAVYFPSSPEKFIRAAAPRAQVIFDPGNFPADAAALAAHTEVAIVFVTRHEMEGFDAPNMTLPNGQDALITAVAAANPRTIVVLETGNPVAMPWLGSVGAVLAAWFPGQEGGHAIADVLFGTVNPCGRLPISFPVDDAHSVRPQLPNLGVEPDVEVGIDYAEGAEVGYRWYAAHALQPQFPFGHGLSFTHFQYANLSVTGGKTLRISFEVQNAGARQGADVPQIYLVSAAGRPRLRLIGFKRVSLQAGEKAQVTTEADPRLLGQFNEKSRRWVVPAGRYGVSVGRSSGDLELHGEASMLRLSRENY
jgi:beta-glucosidase